MIDYRNWMLFLGDGGGYKCWRKVVKFQVEGAVPGPMRQDVWVATAAALHLLTSSRFCLDSLIYPPFCFQRHEVKWKQFSLAGDGNRTRQYILCSCPLGDISKSTTYLLWTASVTNASLSELLLSAIITEKIPCCKFSKLHFFLCLSYLSSTNRAKQSPCGLQNQAPNLLKRNLSYQAWVRDFALAKK